MKESVNSNSYLLINLSQIKSNYLKIRNIISGKTKICCVVKANAYGHGAIKISKLYERLGADYFAVANFNEAIELRKSGIKKPILILSHSPISKIGLIEKYDITQTVGSFDYYLLIRQEIKKQIKVHIKIDTGMSRMGFLVNNHSEMEISTIYKDNKIRCEGIYTHFSSNKHAPSQFCLFNDFLKVLADKNVLFDIKHCCSSASIIKYPMYHLDMVRPGIILYNGLSNSDTSMSLVAHVISVKRFSKGTKIGYNESFVLKKDTNICVVSVGYGDGLPRCISNRNYNVFINGKLYPIIGNICMDQCMVDLGDDNCALFDTVIVFGNKKTPIHKLSSLSNTIDYEILCNMNERLEKIYK